MAAGARAQDTTATISGSVADAQGQSVEGATVTVVHEGTMAARMVATDARGGCRVTTLPPGPYTVRIEKQNFRTFERTRNVLSASDRLSLGTIRLGVGLGESVVV